MRTTPVALIEFLGLAPASRQAAPAPERRAPGAYDYQLPGRDWSALFDGIACLGALRPIVFLHLAVVDADEPEAAPIDWQRIH